jgi:hypothetical protein
MLASGKKKKKKKTRWQMSLMRRKQRNEWNIDIESDDDNALLHRQQQLRRSSSLSNGPLALYVKMIAIVLVAALLLFVVYLYLNFISDFNYDIIVSDRSEDVRLSQHESESESENENENEYQNANGKKRKVGFDHSRQDWIERIRNGRIVAVRGLQVGGSSTSDKYLVHFGDGAVGFGKLIQEDNMVHWYVPLWRRLPLEAPEFSVDTMRGQTRLAYFDEYWRRAENAASADEASVEWLNAGSGSLVSGGDERDDEELARRLRARPLKVTRYSHYQYQGGPEVVAFYVDQVLGFNRVMPVAGRRVSHRLFREGTSLFDFFRYVCSFFLSDYEVLVAVAPFFEDLTPTSGDSANDMRYLTQHPRRQMLPAAPDVRKWLLHMSDSLLFSYLMDDHDRTRMKNWKAHARHDLSEGNVAAQPRRRRKHSAAAMYDRWHSLSSESLSLGEQRQQLTDSAYEARAWDYLIWDNGLSFAHGPFGAADNKCIEDILCGPLAWSGQRRYNLHGCNKVCVFRQQTVDKLRTLALPSADMPGRSVLGYRLRRLMQTDEAHPLFRRFGFYTLHDRTERIVRFTTQQFLLGIDYRLRQLLEHIDDCVDRLGEQWVLVQG